jgi:DNA-binding beta-propeller fold protein YncE
MASGGGGPTGFWLIGLRYPAKADGWRRQGSGPGADDRPVTISAHLARRPSVRIAASALLVAGALLSALLFAAPARAEFGFLAAWGGQGSGAGQFEAPAGVAADAQGDVYVADSFNNRVQVFGPCHEFVASLGGLGSGAGQLNTPLDVAIGPDGNVYVADTGNDQIEVFDPTGGFVRAWGGGGSRPGQLELPFAVAVDPQGNVYVADTGNNRVQKFAPTGSLLAQWGRFGSGNGQFNMPYSLAVGPSGDVYVADTGNHRVQEFNPAGGFVRKWGSFGSLDGRFNSPRGIAAGPGGELYVADTNNSRIEEFSADGGFLGKWGSLGSGDGQFQFAVGVGTDPLGDVYVTENYPNDRVQMFGDPPPTIADLIAEVEELHLPHGIANSLVAKLKKIDEGDPAASAAGRLGAFVAELNAQSGKKVPADAAARLIADAARVGGGPSCPPGG